MQLELEARTQVAVVKLWATLEAVKGVFLTTKVGGFCLKMQLLAVVEDVATARGGKG